jgi:porin
LILNPASRRALDGPGVDMRSVDLRSRGCSSWSCVAAFAIGFALPATAKAQDAPPSLTLAVRDTADLWIVTSGSDPGTVGLNKLQLSATLNGDRSGFTGWSLHGQVFRADGGSLSARLGDIQTADNIETAPVTRLFEAWLQKSLGTGDRTLALRAGLLDYNADFDSLDTASLFLNSSHGIGADVARSGRNGPSIFPVSAFGVRAAFSPSATWTFRLAVFDGVPGDPADPRRFVTVRLRPGDGALISAQVDYHLSDKARIALGAWQYSRPLPQVAQPTTSALDHGIYAAIEGPLPGQDRISGWLRIGYAAGNVQPIRSYFGAGVVVKAPLPRRPDDRLGFALARASVSADNAGLPLVGAETSLEATYQFKVSDGLALQPESQYIFRPSGRSDARDGFAFGLRLIFTAGYPRKAPATQSSDPTVPPDGPQPPDQSSDKPS